MRRFLAGFIGKGRKAGKTVAHTPETRHLRQVVSQKGCDHSNWDVLSIPTSDVKYTIQTNPILMWTEVSRSDAAVEGGEMVTHMESEHANWGSNLQPSCWEAIGLEWFLMKVSEMIDLTSWPAGYLHLWKGSVLRDIYHVHFCATFSSCCSFDAKHIWITKKTTTVLKLWICVDFALVYANGTKLQTQTQTLPLRTQNVHILQWC